MGSLVVKRFVKLVIVAMLAGCVSSPEKIAVEQPPTNLPQLPVLDGNSVEDTQLSSNSAKVPGSRQYAAKQLTGTYANSSALKNFISRMVHQQGFSLSYLNGLFSQANRLDSVIRLENPAPPTVGPTKPSIGGWTRYRDKFLTESHINNGVEFWRNNADAIQKASATYNVDPEYIVGIIGVETYFGKNFGKTNILDALTTLSFDTVRRSNYFMSELESFLLMARDEGFDPRQPQGSWAGAMGYGQFMPSNFKPLAVDFNNDGRRDLWHAKDAIGSVANYFSHSGWQLHNPVTKRSIQETDASVIELSTYEGNEYWRIYPNFAVIKKYNNSNKYAMAVHQLAQSIKQRYVQVNAMQNN
ncbi:MAG: lytic murein transglycosylase [Methylococcales bacterium]